MTTCGFPISFVIPVAVPALGDIGFHQADVAGISPARLLQTTREPTNHKLAIFQWQGTEDISYLPYVFPVSNAKKPLSNSKEIQCNPHLNGDFGMNDN